MMKRLTALMMSLALTVVSVPAPPVMAKTYTDMNQAPTEQQTFKGAYKVAENLPEKGVESSLASLAGAGLIDSENYLIRQNMKKYAEGYLKDNRTFTEEIDEIIKDYGNVKSTLESEKGSALILDVVNQMDGIEDILSNASDLDTLKAITETGTEIISKDSEGDSTENLSQIIIRMEKIIEEAELYAVPDLTAPIKGTYTYDGEVLLRWQHDQKWTPAYGYNLYRITDEKAYLLDSGISAPERTEDNLGAYVSKIAPKMGVTDIGGVTKELNKSLSQLVEQATLTEEKAVSMGFESKAAFEAFAGKSIQTEKESLVRIDGDELYQLNRAKDFIGQIQGTYDPDDMGLGNMLTAAQVSERLELQAISGALPRDVGTFAVETDQVSVKSDASKDEKKTSGKGLMGVDMAPVYTPDFSQSMAAIQLQHDDNNPLNQLIDARSLLSGGSDVDFDLAVTMGLGYVDQVRDESYALYVLEPVEDPNEVYDINKLGFEATKYAHHTGILKEEGKEEDVFSIESQYVPETAYRIASVDTTEPLLLAAPEIITGYGLDNKVSMRWITGKDSELRNIVSGYNIYRKKNDETEFSKINTAAVVVPLYSRVFNGAVYTFESPIFYEDTDIRNGDRAEYKVEAIDIFGRRSGMSNYAMVIDKVIKTELPSQPLTEQPYFIDKTVSAIPDWYNKTAIGYTEKKIILPLSQPASTEDVVLFNVYRSKAYGNGRFTDPELVKSINAIGKQFQIHSITDRNGKEVSEQFVREFNTSGFGPDSEVAKKINTGEYTINSMPGTYYEDGDIERGYYYKYWVSSVDSWGNESTWSDPMTIDFPTTAYNGVVRNGTIDVVRNAVLDTKTVPAGFVNSPLVSAVEELTLAAVTEEMTAVDLSSVRMAALGDFGLPGNIDVGSPVQLQAARAGSLYGKSITEMSLVPEPELPEELSEDYLNLPDVNQIHTMVTYQAGDLNPDNTLDIYWPHYTGKNLKAYAVYGTEVTADTYEAIKDRSKADIIDALTTLKKVGTTVSNSIRHDAESYLYNGNYMVYIVFLIPEDSSQVADAEALNKIVENNAVGGFVRLDWDNPSDRDQVDYYEVAKARLDSFDGYDRLDMEALNWSVIDAQCAYTHLFEKQDQTKEQFLVYRITPVDVFRNEGEPIYLNIRVPYMVAPDMPEVLMPFSNPDGIEVRFSAVADAKAYTVYRATTKSISRLDLNQMIGDEATTTLFPGRSLGTAVTPAVPLTAVQSRLLAPVTTTLSDIYAGDEHPWVRNDIRPVDSMTTTQVVDGTAFIDNILESTKVEKMDLVQYMIDHYGYLSVFEYSDLSARIAATVGWEEIATVEAPEGGSPAEVLSYFDETVQFGNEYHYTVTASNTDLESMKPEPQKALPKKSSPFEPPTGVAIESQRFVSEAENEYYLNHVTWDHVTHRGFTQEEVEADLLVGYIVYRSTEADGDFYQVSPLQKETDFYDHTTNPMEAYHYRVRAVDIAGLVSDYSEPVALPVAAITPSKLAESTIELKQFGGSTIVEKEAVSTQDLLDYLNAPGQQQTSGTVDKYNQIKPSQVKPVTPPTLFEQQTALLGFEPSIRELETERGWIDLDELSRFERIEVNAPGGASESVDDSMDRSRVWDIYREIQATGTYTTGMYTIVDIDPDTVKKDGNYGYYMMARGNLLLGETDVKIPVVFKVDKGHSENYTDEIHLGLYPFMSEATGLYVTDMSIMVSDSYSIGRDARISGYISNPAGERLLPDLTNIYFEDADIIANGHISFGSCPAFRYGDYHIHDIGTTIISLDMMHTDNHDAFDAGLMDSFPIEVNFGKATYSFGYPTVDGKGLEYGFRTLGIIPGEAFHGSKDNQEGAIADLVSGIGVQDMNLKNGQYKGVYGEIEVGEEGTYTEFIVPTGIGLTIENSRIALFGDTQLANNNWLKGEVVLPFFDAPDEFLGGRPDYIERKDLGWENSIDAFIVSLYDEESDFSEVYLDEAVFNIFDRVREQGLVVIGGNAYGLSTVPFDLQHVDLQNGFILEDMALEPTMVGNYDIRGIVTPEYNNRLTEENSSDVRMFEKMVEQSFVLQTEDASVDLSAARQTTDALRSSISTSGEVTVSSTGSGPYSYNVQMTGDLRSPVSDPKWYNTNDWKGIFINSGTLAVSNAVIKQKTEDGMVKPVLFDLEPGEMLYDRNGFMYQNQIKVQAGQEIPIEFGRHFGGFTDAKLRGLTIDMYNNKFDFEAEGTVLIKTFMNEAFEYRMQTETFGKNKIITAHLLPKSFDISMGVNGETGEHRVAMDIYGGYFDEEGVHINGELDLQHFDEATDPIVFTELIVPAYQEGLLTTRDSLGDNEVLRKGTGTITSQTEVRYKGFDIQLNFFDLYTITDGSRNAVGVLGDRQPILETDIKVYGSTAMTDNMEKGRNNVEFYIDDMHGAGRMDFDRTKIFIKTPYGDDGAIYSEVKAEGEGSNGLADGYMKALDTLEDIQDINNAALDTAGDVQAIIREANALAEAVDSKKAVVMKIKDNIAFEGKRIISNGMIEYAMIDRIENELNGEVTVTVDTTRAREIIMNEARAMLAEQNELVIDFNEALRLFTDYMEINMQLPHMAAAMVLPPGSINPDEMLPVVPVDEALYMDYVDDILDALESELNKNGEMLDGGSLAVGNWIDGYTVESSTAFGSYDLPDGNISIEGYDVSGVIAAGVNAVADEVADGVKSIYEDSEEALDAAIDGFKNVKTGLEAFDNLMNRGIVPGMRPNEDGYVDFIISGDEAASMVSSEAASWLSKMDVQAMGRVGYKVNVRDTTDEDMYFYAIGIGYIQEPNESGVSLGLLELSNIVALTGYNMELPYTREGGYTMGYGSDLLKSIGDFNIDDENKGEDFFVMSADAFVMNSRQKHVMAIKEMRYVSESDGSFEINGSMWGPQDMMNMAKPSPNNSEKCYGRTNISYNARKKDYKLLSGVRGIPIEYTLNLFVGGSMGLDWGDDYWMFKMGYPDPMVLEIRRLKAEGQFGMKFGKNAYSKNPVFEVKMGAEYHNGFEAGIVYANVAADFEQRFGYSYYNLRPAELDYPWYEDGKAFEGIAASTKLSGSVRGGIVAGSYGKYEIIDAMLDCRADIINPREDLLYYWTGDDWQVRNSGVSDSSTWMLYAGIRIKYNLDLWVTSYSDNFMYDYRTDL